MNAVLMLNVSCERFSLLISKIVLLCFFFASTSFNISGEKINSFSYVEGIKLMNYIKRGSPMLIERNTTTLVKAKVHYIVNRKVREES